MRPTKLLLSCLLAAATSSADEPLENQRAAQGNALRVVQFIHPGGEHEPDSAEGRSWNTGAHRRKFLLRPGRYLTALDAKPQTDDLVFWGEYEPPTRLIRAYDPTAPDGPRFLFAPEPLAFQPNGTVQMNTDPFVFGDQFFYSICKQNNRRGPTALQRLARGSVIFFGSGRERSRFVVDTVFVVADSIEWNLANYRDVLRGKVPPAYFHTSLDPIVDEMKIRKTPLTQTFHLYSGATLQRPVNGMFSFFPCLPAQRGEATGFPRPTLQRAGIITDNLTQGQRLNLIPNAETAREIWEDAVKQILNQGLSLGVYAALPDLHATSPAIPSAGTDSAP